MDMRETNGRSVGLCWPSLKMCEQKRKDVVTQKLGTATPCVTQRVAHCVGITWSMSIAWKAYCARTAEDCLKSREILIEELPTGIHETGGCRPARNIDPHKAMDAPPSMLEP